VHLLDAPALSHESRREIVEQFRMAWIFSLHAEIIGRSNETLA